MAVIFLILVLAVSPPVGLVEKILHTRAFPPAPPAININFPDLILDITVVIILGTIIGFLIGLMLERRKEEKKFEATTSKVD